jgi:hypothetical protein
MLLKGNNLTESETKVLFEDGLTVGGKPLRYTFEIMLKNRTITERDILTMHQINEVTMK